MGIFGSRHDEEKDPFDLNPEVTSAYASYEAAQREALEIGPIDAEAQIKNKERAEPLALRINFGRLLPILGLIVVLILAAAIGFGPLGGVVRGWVAQLNERAMQPLVTATKTASSTAPIGEGTATQGAAAQPATLTPTPTASSTPEPSPTPQVSDTPEPSAAPTSSVAGCVPAGSITLEDVGKELCVTATVFKAEALDTYFSVLTGEPFYYVSYAKGWYASYGKTWELNKGDCVYATGKIEKIGSYPMMQVGYKNPLEVCSEP